MQLLYALGIAICLLLLWQGVMKLREHQRRLRIKLEKVPAIPEEELERHPELGHVRVRSRAEPSAHDFVAAEPAAVEWSSVFHDEPIVLPIVDEALQEEEASVEEISPEKAVLDDSVPVLLTPASVHEVPTEIEQQDMFADELIAPPPSRKTDDKKTASKISALYEKPVEPVRPVAMPAEDKPHVDVQDVIALHVVATGNPFSGEDLLRCVLGYGLRFGEMSIFHRHEQPTGQGRILFSMARAVEPGIFQLESMTAEEVPGVSFFLSLPGVNSILAYDIMIDTARRLATELQGEVLDEQQQVLTRQLVEHYRERVQEFERRRLMGRPSA